MPITTNSNIQTITWDTDQGTAQVIIDVTVPSTPTLVSYSIKNTSGIGLMYPNLTKQQLAFISDVLTQTLTALTPEE